MFAAFTLNAGVVYYCAVRIRSVQQLTHQFDKAFRSKFPANLGWIGTMKDQKLSMIIVKTNSGKPSLNDVQDFIADWKKHDYMGQIAYVGFDDPIIISPFLTTEEMVQVIQKIIPGIVEFTQKTTLLDGSQLIGVFPATVSITPVKGRVTAEIDEARKIAEGFTRKLEDELRTIGSFTVVDGLDCLRQNGYSFVDGPVNDSLLAQTILSKSNLPLGIFPTLQPIPVDSTGSMPGLKYAVAVSVISYRGIWRNVARSELLRTPDSTTILGIFPGSPAERAGLKQGDKIVDMDGKAVRTAYEIVQRVSQAKSGENVEFLVEREGKQTKIKVVLESIPSGFAQGIRMAPI